MPHHNAVAAAWAESKGAWRTFLFWAIPTLVGLAFSAAFQLGFLLPKFGTGSSDLDRCIELSQALRPRAFAPNRPSSSSVTR
jgi:hypothetical protein